MQKWEYLQMRRYGYADERRVPHLAWIDNLGRLWEHESTALPLDSKVALNYLEQKKPPYVAFFALPPRLLDDLGSEGWMLMSHEHSAALFRRPKE